MKILYLPIFEGGGRHERQKANKHGLRTALADYGEVWEWDYANHPREDVTGELRRKLDGFQPDLLFTQFHGADWVTPDQMAQLRADYPALKLVNWNGDVWEHSLTAEPMLDLLRNYDMQLVVNASALDVYKKAGVNAAFWPFGYETPLVPLPDVPSYLVLYLGTNYSDARRDLGELLRSLPYSVGIFGDGWANADGECLYDFAYGEALYKSAALTVSDNQFPDAAGYLSNRPFQAFAAGGAMVLQQHVKDLEQWTGLKDGTHYIGYTDNAELPALIAHWLAPKQDKARRKIARAAQTFVKNQHNFEVRVKELFEELL